MILIYDKDLKIAGVAAEYISAIFSVKYYEIGECELYVIANEQNLALYQKGYYIVRSGSETAYIIKYLEINTDSENGNFLVVKGYDAKSFLSQRVLLENLSSSTAAEVTLRNAVDSCLGSTASVDRQIKDSGGNLIFSLGDLGGYTDIYSFSETAATNLGTAVEEACKNLKWGYRIRFNNGFLFEIYKGEDRSDSVEFSPRFDNLKSSQFVDSDLSFANVAVCIPSGGTESDIGSLGDGTGADRFELPNKSSFGVKMSGDEISKLRLGSSTYVSGGSGSQPYIIVNNYKFLAWNTERYNTAYSSFSPSNITEEIVGGLPLLTIRSVRCAFKGINESWDNPQLSDTYTTTTFFLNDMLQREALPLLTEKADTTTFTASIVPEVSFKLNQDYFLGDIIKVTDGAGHSAKARIVEIMEADDENGYSIEPTLEIVED